LSVRRVVAISYGVATFFVAFGCIVIFTRTLVALLVYFLMVVGVVIVVGKLRMVALESRRSGTPSPAAEDG